VIIKAALMEGGADLGWLSGSDPVLDSPDLVALEEDKPLNIIRNIAPVIRRDIATPELVAALNTINQKVTAEDLDAMVAAVAVDGEPVARVAGDYISAQGLGEGLYTGPTKVVGADVPVEFDAPPSTPAESGPLRIAYAPTTDTEIAARVYGGALVNAGIPIQIGGSQDPADILAAMPSGEVQFAPMRLNAIANILNTEKNGNLALPIEGRDVNKMVSRTKDLATPRGIELLNASTANVSSAWTVNSNFVANTGIKTLGDLARVSQNRPVILAGPSVCPERVWCQPFLQDKYGIKFSQFVPLDWGGGLTRSSIDSGAVDVGWLSGNDGGIQEFGFTVLPDDLGRESANPIIPVLDAEALTPQIEKVLNAVSVEFSTDDLKAMNYAIEFEREEITDVVAAWLDENGFS
jgi:osmoprotectant transport system substrate-binding protein